MDNVLVIYPTKPEFREELSSILSGYRIIFNESEDSSLIDAQTAGDAVIIIGNPPEDFLKLCPRLKWLQILNAGTNGFVNGEVKETVLLSCASGTYGHSVSEYMVGQTFMLFKKMHLYRDEQLKCNWLHLGEIKSVQDAVILVVGFGDLGFQYAKRMKALGAYVIGVRRSPQPKPDFLDELLLSDQMEEALPRADLVALTIPGTKDTTGIFGRAQLAKMKPGAMLINVARGFVVDTEALCDALESGALAGAALDVTEPEPLPTEHKLWKLSNAIISPHISGSYSMPETIQYIMKLCLDNARRFVAGETLESLVDYKTGYRIPRV